MSRGLSAATVLSIVLSVTTGRAEVVDRIVATIDGEPITAHEVKRYGEEHGNPAVSDAQLLDALITERLLEQEVKQQGIVVRKEDIEAYVQAVKQRNHLDDDTFERALAAQGMTLEGYRTRIRSELEKTQLVNREIRARVTVSQQEIDRYYQAHLDSYAVSERVTVRDIFFELGSDADDAEVERTRRKAEEVRQLAVDGRKFEDLAGQYSEGPGANKGGLLGTFARGEMEPALDDAAFKLRPKEVSAVIETPKGFHVLRVDDTSKSGHKPLDEVKDQIRESLYNEQLESRFTDWLSKDLRERHHVEVLD